MMFEKPDPTLPETSGCGAATLVGVIPPDLPLHGGASLYQGGAFSFAVHGGVVAATPLPGGDYRVAHAGGRHFADAPDLDEVWRRRLAGEYDSPNRCGCPQCLVRRNGLPLDRALRQEGLL